MLAEGTPVTTNANTLSLNIIEFQKKLIVYSAHKTVSVTYTPRHW